MARDTWFETVAIAQQRARKRLPKSVYSSLLAASEKGFYAMAFVLSLFAAVTVQKNVRDLAASPRSDADDEGRELTSVWRPDR